MDIAQYIADLLNEHSEVGLPGIGTFFKKNISANFKEGIFYPPSHKIEYKQEESSATLLVQHIVSVKHISESSAVYFIERFCENLKNDLKKEDSANILPLGTLSPSKEGYNFEASADWGSAAFFGLPEIKEAEILPGESRSKSISQTPGDKAINNETQSTTEELSSTRSKSWVNVFIITLLILSAALLYFYYSLYYQNPQLKNKKPKAKVVAPTVKPDSLKSSENYADSIVKEFDKVGIHGTQVEKAPDSVTITTKPSKPDSVAVKPRPAKLYEIVVASFGLRSEAQRYIRSLQKKGIEAKVVEDTKKPQFKVSIGTFTSSAAAHKENSRVQKEISKDSWVLTTNNQEK